MIYLHRSPINIDIYQTKSCLFNFNISDILKYLIKKFINIFLPPMIHEST